MGCIHSMFSNCFKKGEIETPILKIDEIYEQHNGLSRLSDLIDNKEVLWKNNFDSKSEQEYFRMVNETTKLRKKYNGNAI